MGFGRVAKRSESASVAFDYLCVTQPAHVLRADDDRSQTERL